MDSVVYLNNPRDILLEVNITETQIIPRFQSTITLRHINLY